MPPSTYRYIDLLCIRGSLRFTFTILCVLGYMHRYMLIGEMKWKVLYFYDCGSVGNIVVIIALYYTDTMYICFLLWHRPVMMVAPILLMMMAVTVVSLGVMVVLLLLLFFLPPTYYRLMDNDGETLELQEK